MIEDPRLETDLPFITANDEAGAWNMEHDDVIERRQMTTLETIILRAVLNNLIKGSCNVKMKAIWH